MANLLASLLEELEAQKKSFAEDLAQVADPAALEEVRIKYLGRKGGISTYFKKMQELTPVERPQFGGQLNELKGYVQKHLDDATQTLANSQSAKSAHATDLTLPGVSRELGHRNPIMQVLDEVKDIFKSMGFEVARGPLVETEYYNFGALNVPEDHPAKDLQDTFYLENGLLLRTHTSPVQVRTMERQQPPIRVIAPGRCFRKDTPDATHTPEFHQVEGLAVGEGISLSHLKGTLIAFARRLFGKDTKVRFRPSFFPFTEPSAEMDVFYDEKLGWLEILGSGMVDPNVLQGVGIDPEKYTGFAFGMGIERIAMLKYQIDDIRHFYDNDIRFLKQF